MRKVPRHSLDRTRMLFENMGQLPPGHLMWPHHAWLSFRYWRKCSRDGGPILPMKEPCGAGFCSFSHWVVPYSYRHLFILQLPKKLDLPWASLPVRSMVQNLILSGTAQASYTAGTSVTILLDSFNTEKKKAFRDFDVGVWFHVLLKNCCFFSLVI